MLLKAYRRPLLRKTRRGRPNRPPNLTCPIFLPVSLHWIDPGIVCDDAIRIAGLHGTPQLSRIYVRILLKTLIPTIKPVARYFSAVMVAELRQNLLVCA